MSKLYHVRGSNWEATVLVDDETFQGLQGYFEAVTRVMEHFYRTPTGDVTKIRVFDGEQDVTPNEDFSIESWKNSEGFLNPPMWGNFILVKKDGDQEFTGVRTDDVLSNAGLVEFLNTAGNEETIIHETN